MTVSDRSLREAFTLHQHPFSCVVQLEEDTDRDRYMSPLEAKQYGLIDEVIGGDDAGFKITGSTRDFPKTKEQYVNWVSHATDSHRMLVFNVAFMICSCTQGCTLVQVWLLLLDQT